MEYGEIEGTGVEILDDAARGLFLGNARVERLWTGARWSEGPAWFAAGRYLVWSDIPNDRMLRWDETDGSVSTFRRPSNFSNGNTVDREGRLVTCEHGARRVTRTEHDGTLTVLADAFQGRRLNSPNDVVVKSDGSVWFTDPPYGLLTDYEGHRGESEIGASHVYHLDPGTGAVEAVATDFARPNGLAFTLDESALLVSDTARSHDPAGVAHIRRLPVLDGRRLGEGAVFADCTAGLFDGFRLDERGNVWSSAGDGVHVLSPEGRLLAKLRLPERVANLTFAGRQATRLLICATGSLYALYVGVRGAAVGPMAR